MEFYTKLNVKCEDDAKEMLTRRELMAGFMILPSGGCAVSTGRNPVDPRVNLALGHMWAHVAESRTLSARARAMLVVPDIVNGALQGGEVLGDGALLINEETDGYEAPPEAYYAMVATPVGLPTGVRRAHHVLFLMTDGALAGLRTRDPWELEGNAPAAFPAADTTFTITSTLLAQPVVGLVFGEDGLFVGARLEGARYARKRR